MTNPLLQVVATLFPVLITAIAIVVLGNAWWDNEGREYAQETFKKPGLSWLLPGWLILMAVFLILGYALSRSFPWWYIIAAALGSLACIGFLKIIVIFPDVYPYVQIVLNSRPNPAVGFKLIKNTFTLYYHHQGSATPCIKLLYQTFPDLSEYLLLEVLQNLQPLHFEPDELVIREGEEPDRFYIIADGEVAITKEIPDRGRVWLKNLGCGEHFGGLSLMGHKQRIATVQATTNVEVLALEADMFGKILESSEETSNKLKRVERERLQEIRASLHDTVQLQNGSRPHY